MAARKTTRTAALAAPAMILPDPAVSPALADVLADAVHAATEASIHPVSLGRDDLAPGTAAPVAALALPAGATATTTPITDAPAQAPVATTPVATHQNAANAVMEQTMKTAEEFMSFGQGNVEAMMRAGQIWATGMQDMSKNLAATAQSQLDQTVSTWKALAGVKSIKEAIDLQSTLARTSLEAAVAETSKLTDASMKLAGQSFAPITERVSLAVEAFGRTA